MRMSSWPRSLRREAVPRRQFQGGKHSAEPQSHRTPRRVQDGKYRTDTSADSVCHEFLERDVRVFVSRLRHASSSSRNAVTSLADFELSMPRSRDALAEQARRRPARGLRERGTRFRGREKGRGEKAWFRRGRGARSGSPSDHAPSRLVAVPGGAWPPGGIGGAPGTSAGTRWGRSA